METFLRAPADFAIPPASEPRPLPAATPEELAELLRARRGALAEVIAAGAGGLESARAYSDLVDATVLRMLGFACERAGSGAAPESAPVSIIATGGYGRRELCPHSDIDITFVPHRENDSLVDRIIKEMFTLVMRVFIDANNMSVGYAYRLLADCASLDHQTTSGLLDARLIAGSTRLFIQLEHDFWAQFNPAEFIFTKLNERRQQRDKFGATPRLVEPNLKEGAGGLRDLQTAVWVTQARASLPAARVRGGRAWEALEREAEISPDEARALEEAKEFLFRTRNALHVITGAERDQLVITRQEEAAAMLGYLPEPSGARQFDTPPVERFMREFYIHAAAVHRIAGQVTRRAENSRLLLGIGLDCVNREVTPANRALGIEDPVWMLWACELAQKYNLTLSDELERAVEALLPRGPSAGDRQQASEVFTRILASPRGAYPILQRMADLGVLGWILPEVGDLMGLIPYDPSHDYTVGQHTLRVVRYLDSLRAAAGVEELSDLRRILTELPSPEQLYLAALLHDAGKTDSERPHAETGADLAEEVCQRLGWSAAASANVAFLVRHHLLMAEISRLRDLNLDETIRDFVTVVDDPDRLNMLYLLTYADTNAVGEGVWTAVKGRFLRDLHRRAENLLAAQGQTGGEGFDDAVLARTRRRLQKELAVENLPPEEVAEHVDSMPAPYILNTSLSDMALHIGFVRRARAGEPTIDFFDDRGSTFTEVTVCTLDDPRPGLLSKIAGVLYAADLDVHSAQVFTRVTPGTSECESERIAIDTLYVDFRGRQLTPSKRNEVATNLGAVLKGETSVAEVLTRRRKPPEIGGPVSSLKVRNDISDSFTVIEAAATDERAMLYRVSGALSAAGFDILSARVSHFKARSMASFYVSGAKGYSDGELHAKLRSIMPLAN